MTNDPGQSRSRDFAEMDAEVAREALTEYWVRKGQAIQNFQMMKRNGHTSCRAIKILLEHVESSFDSLGVPSPAWPLATKAAAITLYTPADIEETDWLDEQIDDLFNDAIQTAKGKL